MFFSKIYESTKFSMYDISADDWHTHCHKSHDYNFLARDLLFNERPQIADLDMNNKKTKYYG